jgi:hypothetical protein
MDLIAVGVVENRIDPLQLGRCQVRIFGHHTENKQLLPTSDLPCVYLNYQQILLNCFLTKRR